MDNTEQHTPIETHIFGNGLTHLECIRAGRKLPNYKAVKAATVPAGSLENWDTHNCVIAELQHSMGSAAHGADSLLDLKIELVKQSLHSCTHCPHNCMVDRMAGHTGFCGVAAETAIHWQGVLFAEESEISPSYEVFTSGCTMRCAFCYSHEHILSPMSGTKATPNALANFATEQARNGAESLSMVGGDPTVHLLNFLRMLQTFDADVPIVWNSNMYFSELVMDALIGVVDFYAGDIHFGNETCAKELGRIPDYLETVKRNFVSAARTDASVVIRHLVMPGHVDCCAIPAMELAANTLPGVPFHLMFQYIPDFRALHMPGMDRTVSPEEQERSLSAAARIGVKLYQDTGNARIDELATRRPSNAGSPVDRVGSSDLVNIIVHPNGSIAFHRLVEELVPVAESLSTGA